MIGTTAAIILGSALAGSKVVSAKIQSNAAKTAAKTQTAAGERAMQIDAEGRDRALAVMGQASDQAANLYNPYREVGVNALPGLQRLAGSAYKGGPHMPVMAAPSVMPPPRGIASMNSAAMPMNGTPMYGQGQMVTMIAPNGQKQAVPANMVQHYQAQGAQVLQ